LVHAATIAASGTLPNSVLAGGGIVERNDAYVMTQPICDADVHSGTCWNDPPTSLPFEPRSSCQKDRRYHPRLNRLAVNLWRISPRG
jgi:hypothetical protein